MIKARVNIETAKKKYKPGEVIKEKLSDADMAFLKKHSFITTEEESGFPDEVIEDDTEDDTEDETGLIPGGGMGLNPDDDFEDESGAEYKDEAALQKLKKEEIVEYAASLGLELDGAALKNDLIDAVLNFIEEKMAQ